MIEKLKITDTDSSKLFVTADLHLNHNPDWQNPIYKIRGYNSAQEMTKGIIRQINETCLSTDRLLVSGDFCLNTTEEEFYTLIRNINPKMYFLRGNHNNPWEKLYLNHCKENFGFEVVGYEWLDKITYLGDYQLFSWNKQFFCCTHFPMYVWDYMKNGAISLVGHSHGSCQLSHPEDFSCKQIDVGWDVWKKPISFQEIMDCANTKKIVKRDHH